MRITQGMISRNMLQNISNSYGKLNKYMDQLSTGKKITRPSGDPVIAMNSMKYRTELTEIKQYDRNLRTAYKWVDSSDVALNSATQVLQKIRELSVQASTDTYDEEERENIKMEVNQLKDQLKEIANTKVSGKYIFNGTKTHTPPVTESGGNITVNSDGSPVKVEVNSGVNMQVNVDATHVFSQDLFDDLDELITALDNNDRDTIESGIENMSDRIDDVINARADLGARSNRLELVENRLGNREIGTTKVLAKNEDVEYEKAITNLITQESLHRAALSAGSRIIQPSLLDFLR